MTIVQAKSDLRTAIKKSWEALSQVQKKDMGLQVLDQIESLSIFKTAQRVALYAPDTRLEIDFAQALMEAYPEKQYAFPLVKGQDLVFCEVPHYEALKPGSFGILEPVPGEILEDLDCIFVPGLAFDAQGFRLGRGGGFYDRLLATQKSFTIGVIPYWAFVYQVPREGHDEKVDRVLLIEKK